VASSYARQRAAASAGCVHARTSLAPRTRTTVTNALSQATTCTYDANGNVLIVTDANSKVTTYVYNNRDQLASVTDAASGVMSFTYDAVGNLLTKTNPRSKTTTYAYDNLSRLTQMSVVAASPLVQETDSNQTSAQTVDGAAQGAGPSRQSAVLVSIAWPAKLFPAPG
jgi:YD repeat-containing protein